jgi:DNA-binding response OmpR family regulator
MIRPTFLVAEPEPLQALSVRKLVLETAKFNVLTAHSTDEGIELFESFPNISAAILVHDSGIHCERLACKIREKRPNTPVIALAPRVGDECNFADHTISSYEPQLLLELIRARFGDPRALPGEQRR